MGLITHKVIGSAIFRKKTDNGDDIYLGVENNPGPIKPVVIETKNEPIATICGYDFYSQAEVDQFNKDVEKYKKDHEKDSDLSVWNLNPFKLLSYSYNKTSLFKSDYQKAVQCASGNPVYSSPIDFGSDFIDLYDPSKQVKSGFDQLLSVEPLQKVGKKAASELEKLAIISIIVVVGAISVVKLIEHEI